MERRDPYRILQVQPDADPDVVQAAFGWLRRHASGARYRDAIDVFLRRSRR